jgi:uncharacterized membrane protein
MGVVTYITVWQLATELFVSIGIIIYVRFFLYRSLFLDRPAGSAIIHFVVLTSSCILSFGGSKL